MEFMPKDIDQRTKFVRDRRKAINKAEKERQDRLHRKEVDEACDNVDRAWSKMGHVHSNPLFSGFRGKTRSTARWVSIGPGRSRLVRA